MSGDLIDTTEMYLKTVFELEEAGIPPMRARITERLHHSGPTVSQTVARMERDGLLLLDKDRRIRFTEAGARRAVEVMRKHRLAERHLVDHLGLELALVHDEACRWEHVMSEVVEKRIADMITPPFVDPFGNQIPGLKLLGITTSREPAGTEPKENVKDVNSLLEGVPDGQWQEFVLQSVGEPVQNNPEVVRVLECGILRPGQKVQVRATLAGVALRGDGGVEVELGGDVAYHLMGTLVVTEV